MTVEHREELKQTLALMFERIESGADITEQLLRINTLHCLISPTAPRMLNHYLERKSYTKALELLMQM